MSKLLLPALFLFACTSCVASQADEDESFYKSADAILSYRSLFNPFRIQRVNMLWEKARKNLLESKLELLYSELKLQDKEELALKRLKADKGDKSGLKEADVRKKLNGIMNEYGLAKIKDAGYEGIKQKTDFKLFKDKKLNRLWEKAEKAGLSDKEMITLKQEFIHHQDKVDQYHNLLEAREADDSGMDNELHNDDDFEENPEKRHDNELNGKAKEIKQGYERLHRLSTNTSPKDFEEPKAEALWKIAQEADFSPEELESLRTELHHFETRISKLHHLEEELSAADGRHDIDEKTEGRRRMDKNVEKQRYHVEKAQEHLERTVLSRHKEL